MPENEKKFFWKKKRVRFVIPFKKNRVTYQYICFILFFLTKKDYICNEMLNSYK